MSLLPPAPDRCQVCAADHPASQAHNAQSLYYQTRFQQQHGRSATWADAVAHLPGDVRAMWQAELEKRNAWTEPPDGVAPIAETDATMLVIDSPGGRIASAAEVADKLKGGRDAQS